MTAPIAAPAGVPEPEVGPELVFGLIGPLGAPMGALHVALEQALLEVNYKTIPIQLIDRAEKDLPGAPKLKEVDYAKLAKAKMNLGNWVREHWGGGSAMARVALLGVRGARKALTGTGGPSPRKAYVLHQLKHPDEIRLLRDVYRDRFLLIGGYAPRDWRVSYVAEQIARSRYLAVHPDHRSEAEALIGTDEYELDEAGRKHKLGQHVREAFPLADVFVDVSDPTRMQEGLRRLVRLLFGYLIHTPTREEQGMFFAKAAAVRSASLARQVGAAITTPDGDLLVVGTNEVPKAGGGQYWEDDRPDHRNFRTRSDVSNEYRRVLLMDVVTAMRDRKWLIDDLKDLSIQDLGKLVFQGPDGSLLKDTKVADIIEYVREVHAEMAAITDAARRGISVKGGTLYVTTYPCHECTRHIIAAGITKVVFIEPYAKSLAAQFHADSVASVEAAAPESKVVFQPFVGVAPRRYIEWFEMVGDDRKGDDGTVATWNAAKAQPRLTGLVNAYVEAEAEASRSMAEAIDKAAQDGV